MKSHEYTNTRRMATASLPGYLLVSLILFSSLLPLSAQSTLVYTGKVIDDETGEGVPYATLSVVNSSRGTTTDEFGAFILMVSEADSKQVKVSSIGYESSQISLGSAVKDIRVRLLPVAYFLEEETIMSAEDILRKTLTDRGWQGENPYWLHMLCKGSGSEIDGEFRYKLDAVLEYYFGPGGQFLGHANVLQKRNLASERADLPTITWRFTSGCYIDNLFTPCDLGKNKCWKNMEVKLEKTTKYDGEKVWIISVVIPKLGKVWGAPNKFARLEAEYVISTSSFAILRRSFTKYAIPVATQKKLTRKRPNALGFTYYIVSEMGVINYRKHNDKYYISHQKNVSTYDVYFVDKTRAIESLVTTNELTAINILEGPKYAAIPDQQDKYISWQINEVPYNPEFWEKIDQQ